MSHSSMEILSTAATHWPILRPPTFYLSHQWDKCPFPSNLRKRRNPELTDPLAESRHTELCLQWDRPQKPALALSSGCLPFHSPAKQPQ